MTEQTNFEKLTTGIEDDLAAQIRASMLKLLLKTSDKTTFADLVKLTESPKYGPVATSITLQELLDAHVEAEGFVPEGTVSEEAEPAKAPRKKKSKVNVGEEVEVSLRSEEEREAYRSQVAGVIKELHGGATAAKEVQEGCGGTQQQVRVALRELVLEGKIVQNGRARATRYFWKEDASAEVLEKYEIFLKELKPDKRADFEPAVTTSGGTSEGSEGSEDADDDDTTAALDSIEV